MSQLELQLNSAWGSILEQIARLNDRVPANLARIAERLGVAEISARPIEFDGYLARRQDGKLAIRYQENQPRTRTRFTIAHEIGHILIAHALGQPIETPVARAQLRNDLEERFANRIAAELLLPASVVAPMLRQARVGEIVPRVVENTLAAPRRKDCHPA